MKKSKKDEKKESEITKYGIAIVVIISLILSFITNEISLVGLIISFLILLFMYSIKLKKSKKRQFFYLLSTFLLLHLVVFPYIYLLLLKYDANSLKFDNYISKAEKNISLQSIEKEFNPLILKSELNITNTILQSDSLKLDTSIAYLNSGNILKIDTLMIFTSPYIIRSSDEYDYIGPSVELKVCDFRGKYISSIYGINDDYNSRDSMSIREFLYEIKNELNNNLDKYKLIRDDISSKDKYWSYENILSYCINIFEAGNIAPKSRLANVVFFLHKSIAFGFFFSFLIGILIEVLNKKRLLKNNK